MKYYSNVPWVNREEWLDVYTSLSKAGNTDSKTALSAMMLWKARSPSLVSSIESTLSLLEVLVQDLEATPEVSETVLRLAYSSAVMRFVNHTLDSEHAKGGNLYMAAKKLDIPEWMINLRHETAHSDSLPSLTMLREAADAALKWLKNNYWDKQNETLTDFVYSPESLLEDKEIRLARLIKLCMTLSICSHSVFNVKNLDGIPDNDMKDFIFAEAEDLFGKFLNRSNMKLISIAQLIALTNKHCKKLLQMKAAKNVIMKTILGEDSLFLSLDVLKLFGSKDFIDKQVLPVKYVMSFEVLLCFLHTNDLILGLILDLLDYTMNSHTTQSLKTLAALWLREIFRALRKTKLFLEKFKSNADMNHLPKKKKDLLSLFFHWYPNEKHGLTLNLMKPVPAELTKINYIQGIISNYNPLLTIFIKACLNILEPPLPKKKSKSIEDLATLISRNTIKSCLHSDSIFTVDDAKKALSHINNESKKFVMNEVVNQDQAEVNDSIEKQDIGLFRKTPILINWENLPLGALIK